MKTLLLIRHAKSDWPENTEDFDRPLTELGKINAPKMAKLLLDHQIMVDTLISSPAKRANDTCALFAEVFNSDYATEPTLYNPREVHFENIIYALNKEVNTVAIFSHNNGISNFANTLTNGIINLPTCGIAVFNVDCDDWSDFEIAKKKLEYFFTPKKDL